MKIRQRLGACLLLLLAVAAAPGAAVGEELRFPEFYQEGVLGLSFSAKTKSLAGSTVEIAGFMAPPLKARGNFFVLTREPVSLCPFCNSDADWPADIVVVYLKTTETFRQRNQAILVTGRLAVGTFIDPETGFVSLLRLEGATYKDL
jgi:hypothetical protein